MQYYRKFLTYYYECGLGDILKCTAAGIPVNNFIITPTFTHGCDNTHIIQQAQFNFNDSRTLIFWFDRIDGVHPDIYNYQKLIPDDALILNDLYFAQLKSFVMHNNNHYVCC